MYAGIYTTPYQTILDHTGLDQTDLLSPVIGSNDPLLQGPPVFIQEPNSNYYIVKNRPVKIVCKATAVVRIHFKCAGQMVRQKSHISHESVDPNMGIKTMETMIEVHREEVEEYFGSDGYWCECHAYNTVAGTDSIESVISKRGLVEVSYLRRRFEQEPMSKKFMQSETAVLACLPPEGKPRPEVFWLKDGELVDVKNFNFIISSEGNLIINQARLSDTGNYTCGAQNVVSKRLSDSALLRNFFFNLIKFFFQVDGSWSSWNQWSECSAKCGKGTQRRSRSCSNPSPMNGGKVCPGDAVQKLPCNSICPVTGGWSVWSSWSTCSPDCIHHRKRVCDNPVPANGGDYCFGDDFDSVQCSGGMCRATSKADDKEDIAMYVGLCVAIAVFATVVVIIVIVIRRRSMQRNGMFDMDIPNGDAHLSSLSDDEKKVHKNGNGMLSVQPDLTQTVVIVQTPNRPDSPNNNHMMEKEPTYSEIKEHRLSGTLRKPSKCVEPTINYNLNSSMERLTIRDNKNMLAVPPVGMSSRPLSQNETLENSRQSLMSVQLPSNIDAEAVTWSTFTHMGGRLLLPESGVMLTVPEGAIRKGHTEEIYMAICRDDKDRPKLSDKQTILSPVILCGPQSLVLKKPVILSFMHCASMRQGGWMLSLYNSDTPLDEPPNWQRTVTLGQETINTPVYTQLDPNQCHIMTEQLQRYALIGESVMTSGCRAVKILRLAAFAPVMPPSMDYNVRVYVVEDTQDALEGVIQVERKLGGRLLDKPKQIPFQDGGNNLCLTIEELSMGWRSKLAANYQEIPFRHIWSGNQNNLHCSFSLELLDRETHRISCKIQVYQKAILNNRQMLNISCNFKEKMPSCSTPCSTLKGRSTTVSTGSSSGVSSLVMLDPSVHVFRLPQHIRNQLCMLLDPPNSRGNDWRMLAQALTVDRYIAYFATKNSPTENILDLWEARHREETAVTDLMNILRVMGRMDAAAVLERDNGNGSWL
ncbi:hypothetical protein ScPMuIL_004120 [Solemya velum]